MSSAFKPLSPADHSGQVTFFPGNNAYFPTSPRYGMLGLSGCVPRVSHAQGERLERGNVGTFPD